MPQTSAPSPSGLPPDPDSLLDVKAVAALLGCSTRQVWRLRDAGDLPAAVMVGSLIRWRRAALLAWLDELTEGGRTGG